MRYAAPGNVRSDDRPPVATDIAPSPGAAGRISSQQREPIHPKLWPESLVRGIEPAHPYVRAYWTPIVGTSAVADLLRLNTGVNPTPAEDDSPEDRLRAFAKSTIYTDARKQISKKLEQVTGGTVRIK